MIRSEQKIEQAYSVGSIKKYANFSPDTMVQLVYKETGKGFVKKVRKNCRVLGSYDFYVLLLDVDKKLKISISRKDLLTDNIALVLHSSKNI